MSHVDPLASVRGGIISSKAAQAALLTGAAICFAGVGFGGGLAYRGSLRFGGEAIERQTNLFHRLTSPFLECAGLLNGDRTLVRVRRAVMGYIQDQTRQDPSLQVAVYARDLHDGPWIGIDEQKAVFTPASMWKVPLMMYILAHADSDPAILDREIVFPGREQMRRPDSLEGAREELKLQTGQSYSYRDLLFRMIAYSDNYAEELLSTGVSKADVDRLLYALNAPDTLIDGRFYVTAKEYGALFRVLYNSTLLSRERSETALGFLTRSSFRGGLRKPIPEDVEVASKWGLFDGRGSAGGEVQFHECGIVYLAASPYTLCVLTRSSHASPDRLAGIVAEISRMVWDAKPPVR